jgi:hypothetical protein
MQISWKCLTGEASESVPEGRARSDLPEGDRALQQALLCGRKFVVADIIDDKLSSKVNPASGTDAELIQLFNAWYDLVMLYGKCDMTKESDVFPAISGIAKAIANATGSRYVAGLWQQDLHRGLLWTAPSSTNSKSDLRNYRAPSWSWASLRRTCTFHVREVLQTGRVRTGLFKILRVGLETSEINPFGGVTAGELSVTGLLKRAHPRGIEGEEIFEGISPDNDRSSLFDLEQRCAIGYYFPDNVDRKYLTEIWCSPVMTETHANPWRDTGKSSNNEDARCLALYPISKTDRIYMRVGLVWILDFGWFDDDTEFSFSII